MTHVKGPQVPDGVSDAAWSSLARVDGTQWAIAERNADGEPLGTAYRHTDGSKTFERGGKRGLVYRHPLPAYAGSSENDPVFVCEGASDTAALLGLDLDAVGVPMAGQCGAMLADLLQGRHTAIVRDRDDAGMTGAQRLVQALAPKCASVRSIDPPFNAKDARDAIVVGARRDDFLSAARASNPFQTRPLESETKRNEFDWISIDQLGPAEEPDWLWPGYLVRGSVSLLTGLWKAGKSTLLAHLLRDLYRGSGLVNRPVSGPVLIVSEEPDGIWSARREDFELDNRIRFLRRPSFARPSEHQWLELVACIVREARDHSAELVVFDTLPSCWPVTNENDAGEVMAALSPLRDIAATGAAVLLIHHPRKGESSNYTSARGSGSISAFPDILIEFGRDPNGGAGSRRRVLQATGRYDGIPGKKVLELQDDGYTVLGSATETRHDDGASIVASILADSESNLTTEQILERWTTVPQIGAARLRRLLRKGSGDDRWTETGSGRKGDPFRYGAFSPPADSFRSDVGTQGREAMKNSIHGPTTSTDGELASRDISIPAD